VGSNPIVSTVRDQAMNRRRLYAGRPAIISFVSVSGRAVWSDDVTLVRPWAERIGAGTWARIGLWSTASDRDGVPGALVVW
jgi:hypothetical protein